MWSIRKSIVEQIEAAGGRHDEVEIYGGAPGDPGIGGGPGSISWELNGDLASLVVGGTAAIIRPSDRLKASLIRWAYPELPCKAMAIARAGALRPTAVAA